MSQNGQQINILDEILQLSILYDFYGDLLSSHKKQIFEDYVLNDLSLSEIAVEQGISRQGVHDIIKRCSRELKEYESKLELVKRFESIRTKLIQIKELSKCIELEQNYKLANDIDILADDIIKEL